MADWGPRNATEIRPHNSSHATDLLGWDGAGGGHLGAGTRETELETVRETDRTSEWAVMAGNFCVSN